MRRAALWTASTAGALALLLPAGGLAATPPELTMPAAEYGEIHVQKDAKLAMPDGVTLFADVFRPAHADGSPIPGRYPAVLVMTPYNKNTPAQGSSGDPQDHDRPDGLPGLFVPRGYVVVIVEVRGTGSSQGTWDALGHAEQGDYERIGAWLREQPWSNGRFGTYGASYLGWSQLLMGGKRLEGHDAIFSMMAGEDAYRDVTWHGGAANVEFMPFWIGYVSFLKALPPNYALSDPVESQKLFMDRVGGGSQFPLEVGLSALSGGELAFDGPFYELRSAGPVAGRIRTPTFMVGGWFDLFARGTARVYRRLRMAPGRKQLLIGPWHHTVAEGRWGIGGGGFGDGLGRPGAPPGLDVLAVAWFDRWLKDVRNGVERFGPVTLYEHGAERWQTSRTWPRGDIRYARRYLTPERSGSAQSLNDGSLGTAPPVSAAQETGEANVANGLCARGMIQWTIGIVPPGTPCDRENRQRELTSFTYTTPPLRDPLHLSGPIGLHLVGSTTAYDTTWTATITDVAPNGQSTELTAGWLVHSRRALDRGRSEHTRAGDLSTPFHPFTKESLMRVEPGRPDALDIEIFPTDVVVRQGHRLRLVVSSGDLPHILAPTPVVGSSAGAVNTVHHLPADPSFLTLPVIREELDRVRILRARRAGPRRLSVRLACPDREESCPVALRARGAGRVLGRRRTTVPAGSARSVRLRLRSAPRRAAVEAALLDEAGVASVARRRVRLRR